MSEVGLSISEGREPGTISIRMSKLDGSGLSLEMEATQGQASRIVGLLGTELARAHQMVRTYPVKASPALHTIDRAARPKGPQ